MFEELVYPVAVQLGVVLRATFLYFNSPLACFSWIQRNPSLTCLGLPLPILAVTAADESTCTSLVTS